METKRKREILFLWPYREWGGVQIYFAGIMKLAREKHIVRAVMPEGSDAKIQGYMKNIGVECDFFPAHMDLSTARSVWHKIRRRLRDARCSLVIALHLRRQDLKNVILHVDLFPSSWFWLLAYLSIRSNVFLTLHIGVGNLQWISRVLLKLELAILCRLRGFHMLVANEDMGNSLKPYLPTRTLSPILLARSGIDRAEIDKVLNSGQDGSELRKRYDFPEEKQLVFTLGQVIHRKGIFILLDAVKEIKKLGLPIYFVWIGQGEQIEEAEKFIRENDLSDNFRIIRPAQIGPERIDLLNLMNLADLFVLPAFAEGLPSALLEAMAIGKACIASGVNGIPEAIKDRETGILLPPGDSKALRESIVMLSRDHELRRELAAAGQSYVLKNFDERRAAEITLDFYRACLRES